MGDPTKMNGVLLVPFNKRPKGVPSKNDSNLNPGFFPILGGGLVQNALNGLGHVRILPQDLQNRHLNPNRRHLVSNTPSKEPT